MFAGAKLIELPGDVGAGELQFNAQQSLAARASELCSLLFALSQQPFILALPVFAKVLACEPPTKMKSNNNDANDLAIQN